MVTQVDPWETADLPIEMWDGSLSDSILKQLPSDVQARIRAERIEERRLEREQARINGARRRPFEIEDDE